MKRQKLKLGLNKINVSNLSSIRGGNGSNAAGCVATLSRNFIDVCCPVFGSNECPNTQDTTCHSGHPGCPGWGDDDWAYTYKGDDCNLDQ